MAYVGGICQSGYGTAINLVIKFTIPNCTYSHRKRNIPLEVFISTLIVDQLSCKYAGKLAKTLVNNQEGNE